MERQTIVDILQAGVPNAEVLLDGADCSFTVTVVSPHFQGMRPVARQQLALEGFTEALRTGEIHALSIRAFTPDEWQQQSRPIMPAL